MSAAATRAPSAGWDLPSRVAWLLVCCAALLPWFSLTDHPAWPPEEGRYGQVAATMVETGDWLVPVFRGEAHLTKPPLSYWAIAAATELFGRGAAAVRVPSALATSGVVLLCFLLGSRLRSRAAGVAAALLFAVMPLTMVAGRLGAPDAMMTFAWFGSLVGALLALDPRTGARARLGWCALFWGGAGAALLLKAPLGLAPICIVFAGIAVSGRWSAMRALLPLPGIALALGPFALWAWMVARAHPQLPEVLWEESVGRATGDLGKHAPWWTYIPVFLGGLWPATAMLTLPVFNLGWRESWERLRADPILPLAILGPLVVFSLSAGKLPHYLLPVAPPLAVLCGMMLAGWMESAPRLVRPPDVRFTLLVTAAMGAVALTLGVLLAPASLAIPAWWGAVMLPAVVGAAFLVWQWPVVASRRRGLLVAWLGIVGSWMLALEVEDQVFDSMGAPTLAPLVERAQAAGGRLLAVVDTDTTRPYYFGEAVVEFGDRDSAAAEAAEAARAGDIALVDRRLLPGFERAAAERGLAIRPGDPATVRLLWWRDAGVWTLQPAHAKTAATSPSDGSSGSGAPRQP
ncbi:MAG: glycosyltransferase family 39 protein [Phycisphaerales bacterium]